jgi:dihydrofolate reductase
MLSLIVAMAEGSRVIGLEGDMPWKLSADLRRFKEITTGHTVAMGRKTWESIPPKFRPLPNRKNIVLTRQASYIESVEDGVGIATSLEEVVSTHRAISESPVAAEWGDLFVIGGESVFREALPLADRIYLTLVSYSGDGDTFFPEDPLKDFEPDPAFERETVPADEKNSDASVFMVLRRRPSE